MTHRAAACGAVGGKEAFEIYRNHLDELENTLHPKLRAEKLDAALMSSGINVEYV